MRIRNRKFLGMVVRYGGRRCNFKYGHFGIFADSIASVDDAGTVCETAHQNYVRR
jgi:hypothetical protein